MQTILDHSLHQVSSKMNVIIITKCINPFSLFSIFLGGECKPYNITAKTKNNSDLSAGYIPSIPENPESKPLILTLEDSQYHVAISSKEKEYLIPLETNNSTDKLVHCITNKDHKFITSDLDLVAIIPNKEIKYQTETFFDSELGYITDLEREVISLVNHTFNLYLVSEIKRENVKIVRHGSFSRLPKKESNTYSFYCDCYIPDKNTKISSITGIKLIDFLNDQHLNIKIK